jgi:hypothetical protein
MLSSTLQGKAFRRSRCDSSFLETASLGRRLRWITLKAFANSSPWVALFATLGRKRPRWTGNPERVCLRFAPQSNSWAFLYPGLQQPWAGIRQRFQRHVPEAQVLHPTRCRNSYRVAKNLLSFLKPRVAATLGWNLPTLSALRFRSQARLPTLRRFSETDV